MERALAWRWRWLKSCCAIALALGGAAACSGSSDTDIPEDMTPDASSPDGSATPPDVAADGEGTGRDATSRDGLADSTTRDTDAEGATDRAAPADVAVSRDTAGPDASAATDGGASDVQPDRVPSDAALVGRALDVAGDAAEETSSSVPDAPGPDAARVCGVPGNCVASAPLPAQSTQSSGITLALCPNGADVANGVCVVDVNLSDAAWTAAPGAGPNDLDGTVGFRARDIVLVASTPLGQATCHLAVGGSGFAPVPVRIRLGAPLTADTRVGCSALTVSSVVLLGPVPATVTGPALCSAVVLPILQANVVVPIQTALQQAIEQRICLR